MPNEIKRMSSMILICEHFPPKPKILNSISTSYEYCTVDRLVGMVQKSSHANVSLNVHRGKRDGNGDFCMRVHDVGHYNDIIGGNAWHIPACNVDINSILSHHITQHVHTVCTFYHYTKLMPKEY
jgi:hypothetical protein